MITAPAPSFWSVLGPTLVNHLAIQSLRGGDMAGNTVAAQKSGGGSLLALADGIGEVPPSVLVAD
ncbi:MAG: hypothetical protein WA708_19290 [Acidobacteriaceae bacterium]